MVDLLFCSGDNWAQKPKSAGKHLRNNDPTCVDSGEVKYFWKITTCANIYWKFMLHVIETWFFKDTLYFPHLSTLMSYLPLYGQIPEVPGKVTVGGSLILEFFLYKKIQ